MRTAIAFLTKDHPELTRRSIEPLLQRYKFDLHIVDGSTEYLGVAVTDVQYHTGIRGGPDAAITYALTHLLKEGYDYVGLCEQDVLLHPDWFGPTMALFDRGRDEGLLVGAVSPRAYSDRILLQRDGYAVMHNLGAGCVIFSAAAARTVLENYRTGYSHDNRRIFSALSGKDIAAWWAFGANDTPLTADWHFDAILAAHGYASLALVPQLATMLDQDVSSQGLSYASSPAELLRDNAAFSQFAENSRLVREGTLKVPCDYVHNEIYLPHQLSFLGGTYVGDWGLHWSQGFGPFAWKAKEVGAFLTFQAQGPLSIFASSGQLEIRDMRSGWQAEPLLSNDSIVTVVVPGGVAPRWVSVCALTPGAIFHGVGAALPQAWRKAPLFDWTMLPRV